MRWGWVVKIIGKMNRKELKQAILMCFEYAPDADPVDRLAVLQEAHVTSERSMGTCYCKTSPKSVPMFTMPCPGE
jgi:hypothetical protein